MLYMLDTDTASYLIKGRSPGVERRMLAVPTTDVCISVMTRAELLYGLKTLQSGHRLHIAVQQFLRIVRAMPWDNQAADWYADIRHDLRASGKPIGEMDMQIAAHSLATGATLVTNNLRHYSRIKAPLILENWA